MEPAPKPTGSSLPGVGDKRDREEAEHKKRGKKKQKKQTTLNYGNVFATKQNGPGLRAPGHPAATRPNVALELLRCCRLEGCIVTGDALYCSRPLVDTVLGVVAIRGLGAQEKNQSKSTNCSMPWRGRFDRAGKRQRRQGDWNRTTHDRHESRRDTVIREPAGGGEPLSGGRWPWLASLAQMPPWQAREKNRRVRYYVFPSISRPSD